MSTFELSHTSLRFSILENMEPSKSVNSDTLLLSALLLMSMIILLINSMLCFFVAMAA